MRHRRFLAIAVVAIVLLALAAGGVAAWRSTQSPIIATLTLGGTYLPQPVVDEPSGHAFVVTGSYGQSSSQARIRMLDTRDGRIMRTLKMPWFNNNLGIGGVDERAGRLYLVVGAVTGNNVFLFDTKTGKRVATTHIDDPSTNLLVDADAGRIYVIGYTSPACTNNVCTEYDGSLSTLDARTGKLLRTVHLKKLAPGGFAVDPASHRLIIMNIPLVAGSYAISLYDLRTGRRIQQVKLPARSSAYLQPDSMDDTTGRMYLVMMHPGAGWISASSQGPPPRYSIGVFDTRTGRILRTLTAVGNPISVALQPGVPYLALTAFGPWRYLTITSHENGGTATNTLLSPTGPGRLELRDRRTMSVLHAVTVAPGAFGAAIDARRGRVYVLSRGSVDPATGLTGPGTVSVVDAASGHVLRTLAVGMEAMSLTLDARAGRLLVAHSPSYIPIATPDPWGWIPRQLRRRLPFIPQTAPRPRSLPARLTIIDTGRL